MPYANKTEIHFYYCISVLFYSVFLSVMPVFCVAAAICSSVSFMLSAAVGRMEVRLRNACMMKD